jgi:hypothetical protein
VSRPAFTDPAVAAAFATYPEPIRSRLLGLRQQIFETAAATAGVGPLQETLKWGQPAYLTPQTRSGSTLRIDRVAGSDDVALYCHCQTDLISVFRELYPQRFRYQGNRALVLDQDRADAAQPLSHCIALALTYHLRRKAARGSSVNKSA